MKITEKEYEKLKHLLPIQRGNVTIDNITFINALLYICENGYKWRALPKEYGSWHASYKRFRRWVGMGVIEKMFRELHVLNSMDIKLNALFMDSTIVRVHPDACGALKKVENNP